MPRAPPHRHLNGHGILRVDAALSQVGLPARVQAVLAVDQHRYGTRMLTLFALLPATHQSRSPASAG